MKNLIRYMKTRSCSYLKNVNIKTALGSASACFSFAILGVLGVSPNF